MAKRKVYSFADRKYSSNSVTSAVLSVLSLLFLVGLLWVSFLLKGRASSWIGAMGLLGIVLAFSGLSFGFAGFKDDCKSYLCCKIGTLLSTLVIVGWFLIVCIGIAQG